MRSAFVPLLVAACAPRGHASPVPPRSPALLVSPSEPAGATEASGPVRIEPYVAAARPLSILEPRDGESLAIDAASGSRVVLDDSGYLDENPGARVALVFDGDFVRDVADAHAPLTLGALGVDSRDIRPGEHALVAVLVGPRGDALRFGPGRDAVVAVRRFFVGAPSSVVSTSPVLVFLAPRGTYNGPNRVGSALLDFVLVGDGIGPGGLAVRVRIAGPHEASSAVLRGSGPFSLKGLGNGDYRFDLELVTDRGAVEGPWAHAARTVTVNLDGPER